MKNIALVVLAIVMASMCIGQQPQEEKEPRGWTVQQWRDHLTFMSPPLGQDATSMVPAFRNSEALPIGTHIVYQVQSVGTFRGAPTSMDMTMDVTISGKEVINGIDCTVMDIVMDILMGSRDESFTMVISGKEWVDQYGTPVRVEEETTMKFSEYDVPISMTVERTGEELYYGHDCWVFSGTQTTNVMGKMTEGVVLEYVDKKSAQVVRAVITVGEEEADTGYIEPPLSIEELEWKLGERETATTEMGEYDCQIIYLKEDDEVVGTLWVNEDIRAPLKYVFSYRTADMDLVLTMTLIEYTLGE